MDELHQQIELERARMQLFVLKMISYTLVGVMGATVFILLVGLFMPNSQIDNNEIWKILGPAFFSVSGAMTGAFATMMGMKTKEFNPNAAQDTYVAVKQSDDRYKSVQAHEDAVVSVEETKAEATVSVAKIEADAAVEMQKLASGYYKPITYEDGHTDPDHFEGSRSQRWDESEKEDGDDEEQPAASGHWTQRTQS